MAVKGGSRGAWLGKEKEDELHVSAGEALGTDLQL